MFRGNLNIGIFHFNSLVNKIQVLILRTVYQSNY